MQALHPTHFVFGLFDRRGSSLGSGKTAGTASESTARAKYQTSRAVFSASSRLCACRTEWKCSISRSVSVVLASETATVSLIDSEFRPGDCDAPSALLGPTPAITAVSSVAGWSFRARFVPARGLDVDSEVVLRFRPPARLGLGEES